MKDFSKISKKMKEDWDRRVSHDYRFWMSDGYQDDQAMWSAGERDLRIITRDIGDRSNKTILELGCGVGRLLHAALPDFHKVIGVDVSEKAIQKAGELLAAWSNLELVLCNGSDLHQVATGSVDVTISFAALTSIPTDIIANYLRELHRVLKPDGTLRLQIYLGSHQEVAEGDTLHVRCYPEDNFRRAAEAAGFSIEWSEELILPFQVSFKEVGITAMIVSLKREDRVPAEAKVISEILLPQGEVVEQVELEGSALEYWMALNYAKELVKGGDMGKAEETLRYAVGHSTATAIDVRDLMQRILSEIEKEGPAKPKPESDKIAGPTRGQGEFFERNWKVLSERFPNTAQVLKLTDARSTKGALEIRSTEQGPVLVQQGQCLDHPTKPTSAAEAWAQKLVADRQIVAAKELAILGLGLGYHIDALLAKTAKPITVIEPSVEAARRALETRDLVSILTRLKAFYIGTDLPQEFSDSDAELVVRPQTQVVAAEFTAKLRTEFLGNRGLSGLSPKIGVLGPIQGGTLPMVPYLANALKSLKQRVRVMDTSDFAGGYAAFDKFVKH